MSPCYQSCS